MSLLGNARSTFRPLAAVVAVVAAAALAACSTAVPTDTPGVTRVGEHLLKYSGSEVQAVLGYRFATQRLGDEWLILELAVSSPTGSSATIERDDIFVRTPGGARIPLATQREFADGYNQLRADLRRAAVVRDPMGYFPAGRAPCGLDLFTVPGGGVSFDEVPVDDRRVCEGRLFFKVPGGIQNGRWVLGIDLEESDIRIPFTL